MAQADAIAAGPLLLLVVQEGCGEGRAFHSPVIFGQFGGSISIFIGQQS